ncbi:A disintegrin and metallopeptidase domain 3-like [Tupaia chinensis]|uniref:A disintegrin and metallopeptidase domain 3-like n=1 Tax=Tupaia chinensis TaxID=246437 RepID=UPI000FFBEAFC|nr:A disintegrin and metallopeptidase domain 3-like [Tupaia chinensis]XP_027622618.1 A disintegrin and metallopeptidase domain 3-like [Tupaia chinensis]
MLYQVKNNKIDHSPLKENYPRNQYMQQSYRILVKSETHSDALKNRTLKIQIIMDKAMFDFMGSEVGAAVEKVVHLFALVNTMFSQLKMTIMLSSVELWSDQNKISTNGDPNDVLQRFVSWMQKFAIQRSSGMTYLLIYRDHPDYVGATYHGKACDPKFAAGIALYSKTVTLEAFSVVMVQLLGISLGLTYDDVHNCYCLGDTCIMNPEAIRSPGVKSFSSCSLDRFKQIISQPGFQCLQNITVPKVDYQYKAGTCGNSILEPPEECDCGNAEKCTHKKCCNPADCTLHDGAECGTGVCCDRNSCLIKSRGSVCRKSKDFCDFPEHCNGSSEFCVPDVGSADFEPCNNKTAFCYGGICRDPDRQCVELFGKFAKGSSYLCAEEVNFQNDKFGNCGSSACDFTSILCGKLVCHWTHAEIVPMSKYDLQYTYLGGHVCLSAHLRKTSATDNTYVDDGTVCGIQKFCQSGVCKLLRHYAKRPACNSTEKCQGHGVCNTLFNCHCDKGYSPPDCDPTPSSPGGSVNDGFWRPIVKRMPLFLKQRAASQKNGLLISLYIFLPILILTTIIVFKWKDMKGFWNKEGTVHSESLSEDSNSNSFSDNSQSELKLSDNIVKPCVGEKILPRDSPLTGLIQEWKKKIVMAYTLNFTN